MDTLSEVRNVELQAVIIVEFDDGRMYPVVEDSSPKCLLPVANRELLSYQLDVLSKSGVEEVYIVAHTDYQEALSTFLRGSDHMRHTDLAVDLVVVDSMTGSADGLRAISERLRGDFIVMSGDSFCKLPLGPLASRHRLKNADVTMLLSQAPYDESEKKGGPKKVRMDEEDREVIAFNDDARVLMKLPMADIEADSDKDGCVEIHKAVLQYGGNLAIKTDLVDMGVYVFSYWVLELLSSSKTRFVSVQADLVPFLVKRQMQPHQELLVEIPALMNRNRSLAAIEPWLIANYSSPIDDRDSKSFELIDFLQTEMSNTDCLTGGVSSCLIEGDPASQRGLRRTASSQRSLANATTSSSKAGGLDMDNILGFASGVSGTNSNSSSPQSARNPTLRASGHVPVSSSALSTADSTSIKDILRCYALIFTEGSEDGGLHAPSSGVGLGGSGVHSDELSHTFVPSARNTEPPSDMGTNSAQCLMLRLNSIQSYLTLNRDVPAAPYNANQTPWPRPTGFVKKEQSLMGPSCEIKDKVTIKTSTIGANCSIGSKSKINNCILMSDVIVGDNVIIQNSVICSGAVIENNCNLNDVSVGARGKVVHGSKLKGESVAAE